MVIKKDITDVIKIFIFSIGFFGAPGSFPLITSFSLSIPMGSVKKKTNHHIITNISNSSKPNKLTPAQVQLMYHRNL